MHTHTHTNMLAATTTTTPTMPPSYCLLRIEKNTNQPLAWVYVCENFSLSAFSSLTYCLVNYFIFVFIMCHTFNTQATSHITYFINENAFSMNDVCTITATKGKNPLCYWSATTNDKYSGYVYKELGECEENTAGKYCANGKLGNVNDENGKIATTTKRPTNNT